ncbi:MAG: bi-domain-containing oxidoreductase [Gammaproteobacteria bacterium]|nr:bi-domain-containing oxidoreductase [Gammaproteobacteria bacterium]
MKQVLIKGGHAYIEEVPVSVLEPGKVLVRTAYSCISPGTEMSGIVSSGEPLWKRAVKDPSKVKKAFEMFSSEGFQHTNAVIKGELESGNASGYSAAGVIVGVGEGVEGFSIGQHVACAGAQCAYHAEYINVPKNLVVQVPDGLSLDKASTVTLGAIALQSVRRASPTLGETFVVIGMGLIGQLVAKLLTANGCRAIGADLSDERLEIARIGGIESVVNSSKNLEDAVESLTKGVGADGVIVTASAPSNSEIISAAFSMSRKKGRVVVVGDVGLAINRNDIYLKELDFLISTSYGPGRYDERYEKGGLDYPIAYVRWTENRNMEAYLQLLDDSSINIDPLVNSIYAIDKCSEAYDSLKPENTSRPLMVLLRYPESNATEKTKTKIFTSQQYNFKKTKDGIVRVGVIGAGGFATATLLPVLKSLGSMFEIDAVCSRTGHTAKKTSLQFGARYATTNIEDVLSDDNIDAVLIATRHDSHAYLVEECLNANKHVFVEKPLALSQEELSSVFSTYENLSDKLVLQTGFNRRFSSHIAKIKSFLSDRNDPLILNYTMNAGYLKPEHWVHGPEGGGRNIGEACHIYDLFNYLTGAKLVNVSVSTIGQKTRFDVGDNFVATVTYDDGSIATLCYTAMGNKRYPKERMEVFCGGNTCILDDYKKTILYAKKSTEFKTKNQDKGHSVQMERFYQNVSQSEALAIPIWQQEQAMLISYKVTDMLNAVV